MIKTLEEHGNSHALIIDESLMESWGIDADTPLRLSIYGRSLIITPAHVGMGRKAVKEAMDSLRPEYGDMLERLGK